MPLVHRVINSRSSDLTVWCEPFCNAYVIPPASTLDFFGEPEAASGPLIEVEATDEGLTLHFNHVPLEPDAKLDGTEILPL